MRILILTDRTGHSESNSFYGIANSIFKRKEVDSVYIGNRGNKKNRAFFSGEEMTSLSVNEMEDLTAYSLQTSLDDEASVQLGLGVFDFILLRLPYPIPSNFFPKLCRHFDPDKIVNNPQGILATSDKAFLLQFKDYTPPITVCNTWASIIAFAKEYPCVLKPRWGHGGTGLIKIIGDRVWIGLEECSLQAFCQYYENQPRSYLAMQYLENVAAGDKRIVVCDGEILACSLRFPKEGSWLCNVSQGGNSSLSEPTDVEFQMIKYIDPIMQSHGVVLYGLDTLEDHLGIRKISEINTLSVGGIMPYEELTGIPVSEILVDQLIKKWNQHK